MLQAVAGVYLGVLVVLLQLLSIKAMMVFIRIMNFQLPLSPAKTFSVDDQVLPSRNDMQFK